MYLENVYSSGHIGICNEVKNKALVLLCLLHMNYDTFILDAGHRIVICKHLAPLREVIGCL
jgi:hypothetical protein